MIEVREAPVPVRYSHSKRGEPTVRGRWVCDHDFWREFLDLGGWSLWVELSNGQTVIVRAKK